MPKISIIVPVYNVENVLERCIDSILDQEYTDFELILINDGSTDKSGEICERYSHKDARVVVYHIANSGVSAARNIGISKAKGEYITFIDSDDYVEKEFIEKLLKDRYDFVCQAYNIVDELGEGKKTNLIRNVVYDNILRDDIIELLMNGQLNGVSCKLYKTCIIKEHDITFNSTINFGEDTLFSIEYLLYAKSALFEDLSGYRRVKYTSKETLSNVYNLERVKMLKKANLMICNELGDDSILYERMIYPYSKAFNDIYNTNKSFFEKWSQIKEISNDADFTKIIKEYPGCCVSDTIGKAIIDKNNIRLFILHTYLFFKSITTYYRKK